MCINNYHRNISYKSLHTQLKRTNPTQLLAYNHSILLHKIYNDDSNSPEWIDLFSNQAYNDRNAKANFLDMSFFKIGKNILSNWFTILNNKIPYDLLNKDYLSFKLTCKKCLSIMNNEYPIILTECLIAKLTDSFVIT